MKFKIQEEVTKITLVQSACHQFLSRCEVISHHSARKKLIHVLNMYTDLYYR